MPLREKRLKRQLVRTPLVGSARQHLSEVPDKGEEAETFGVSAKSIGYGVELTPPL